MLTTSSMTVVTLYTKNQLKISKNLHPLFSTSVLSNLIGDYILGCALLNLDIFPRESISTHELCALLYSIACCHECTMELLGIFDSRVMTAGGDMLKDIPMRFDIRRIPFIYTIMCRYYYMKNERSYNHMLPLIDASNMKLITNYGAWYNSPLGNASLHFIDFNYTLSSTLASQRLSHGSIIPQIARLLVSCGINILKYRGFERYNVGI